MEKHKLALKQLDAQLQINALFSRPKNGWIRTIRKTIGMTAKQLATRLGVERSRIIRIESDETKDALTLKTLKSVANALSCELTYILVPREPLQKMVEKQAYKIAAEKIKRVSHHMSLEAQSLSSIQDMEKVHELKEQLVRNSFKKLWGE